jgi:homoserine kinase
MEDRLHQPYRKKLIPNFDKVIESAYDNGAIGASLSGAGSTMLALATENFDKIGQAMVDAFKEVSIKAQYKVLDVDTEGAKIEIFER